MLFRSGEAQKPDFSWKIADGDATPEKSGFAGCWVLKFSSSFAPKVYERGGTTLITNPDQIKRGHFVRIAGNYKTNGSTTRPGMYLNLSMAEFIGYGEEIHTGPTGDVFTQAEVVHTPQGMSAAPSAPPASALGVVAPVQQLTPPASAVAPVAVAPVAVAPVQQAAPDFGFLQIPPQ